MAETTIKAENQVAIGAASAHTQMSLLTELKTVVAMRFYKHCAPTKRGRVDLCGGQ